MVRFCLALLACLALALPARAGSCGVSYPPSRPYSVPSHVSCNTHDFTRIIFADAFFSVLDVQARDVFIFPPRAVAVPVATIPPAPAVIPPAPPPVPATPDMRPVVDALLKLSTRLDSIESRLALLETAKRTPAGKGDPFSPLRPAVKPLPPPPPIPEPLPPPRPDTVSAGLKVAQTNCSACHTAGKLAEGTDFVLLNADLSYATVNDTNKVALEKVLDAGTMPKKGDKLTAADEAELRRSLSLKEKVIK